MRAIALASLVTLAAFSAAAEPLPKLYPGAEAPKIEVASWVKKGLPEGNKLQRLTVVEFWATWCGPCRTSIPHLTKLAKQYSGKVDFVGVSVWERGDNIPKMVGDFVTQMGDQMDYHVALDTSDRKMANNWMAAAEQRGIPAAFLVDQKGKILWIGHPMELDQPLEEAVAGKLDVEKHKSAFLKEVTEQRAAEARQKRISDAAKMYREGKTAEAEKIFDEVAASGPEGAAQITSVRLSVYPPESEASKALIDRLLEGPATGHASLGMYLINQARNANATEAQKSSTKALALRLADRTTGVIPLYYVGFALNTMNASSDAVKVLDKALAALEKDTEFKGDDGLRKAISDLREEARKKTGN